MDDFNPYAAPRSGINPSPLADDLDEEGRGVWRDESILVLSKHSRLPSRCLKCNEPAATRRPIAFAWHQPWFYCWLILTPIGLSGLMIYLVLMLIYRQTATVEIPLCAKHDRKRARDSATSWVMGVAGLVVIVLGVVVSIQAEDNLYDLVAVFGTIMVGFGLVYGIAIAQVVTPRQITKTHVWLKKVCPAYLLTLPTIPTG